MQPATTQSWNIRRPKEVRWQIALAFVAFILIGANDGGLGVILPGLRVQYSIDKATAGLIFIANTFGYLSAGFTSGLMVEKLGQRLFLTLGMSAFLVGMVLISLGPLFPLLLAAFWVAGFGIAIIDAGLNSFVARLPQSTPILNYLHAFYAAGAFLGPLVASSLLAAGVVWSGLYRVWFIFGLLVLVGVLLFFKPAAKTTSVRSAPSEKTVNVMALAFKTRVVWVAAFFLLIYTGSEVTVSSWGYTFLTEERHETAFLAGGMISAYWLGLMLGRVALGKLSERIGGRRLVQVCLLGVMAGLSVVWLLPATVVAAAGLFAVGFFLGPIFPTTIALVPQWMDDRIVATAIGFLASFASAGAALMPWLAGNLAQQHGLGTFLPFVIALALADGLLWVILSRSAVLSANTQP